MIWHWMVPPRNEEGELMLTKEFWEKRWKATPNSKIYTINNEHKNDLGWYCKFPVEFNCAGLWADWSGKVCKHGFDKSEPA